MILRLFLVSGNLSLDYSFKPELNPNVDLNISSQGVLLHMSPGSSFISHDILPGKMERRNDTKEFLCMYDLFIKE